MSGLWSHVRLGQFAACGPWPPLFAHVVVVVVVVVVVSCFFNPPLTGEVVVSVVIVVSVVTLGGFAKAILLTVAEDARRIADSCYNSNNCI